MNRVESFFKCIFTGQTQIFYRVSQTLFSLLNHTISYVPAQTKMLQRPLTQSPLLNPQLFKHAPLSKPIMPLCLVNLSPHLFETRVQHLQPAQTRFQMRTVSLRITYRL